MADMCHEDYIGTPTDGPKGVILEIQRNARHFRDLQLVFNMAGA